MKGEKSKKEGAGFTLTCLWGFTKWEDGAHPW
jgi:hypothetical protein